MCPDLLSVAVIKHYNKKQLRKGMGLFGLVFQIIVTIEGSQGRNSSMDLEAETEGRSMEKCCLLAYFKWFIQLAPPLLI